MTDRPTIRRVREVQAELQEAAARMVQALDVEPDGPEAQRTAAILDRTNDYILALQWVTGGYGANGQPYGFAESIRWQTPTTERKTTTQ